MRVRDVGRQCTPQGLCGIVHRAACGDGIADHLADVLLRTVRGFQHATVFNPAQHGQDVRRGDFSNRAAAKVGKHVALKAADNLVPMAGGLGVEVACNPVVRNDFERISSQRAGLVGLLDGTGVAALGKVAFCVVAPITRIFQSNDGIYLLILPLHALGSQRPSTHCHERKNAVKR